MNEETAKIAEAMEALDMPAPPTALDDLRDKIVAEITKLSSHETVSKKHGMLRAMDIVSRHFAEHQAEESTGYIGPESPPDLSFAAVNEWVHNDPPYEYVQWLCLSLATALESPEANIAGILASAPNKESVIICSKCGRSVYRAVVACASCLTAGEEPPQRPAPSDSLKASG